MTLLEQATSLRKKIKALQGTISRSVTKQDQTLAELKNIESNCRHDWSPPKLVKGFNDKYEKSCRLCGQTIRSKDVTVKF